MKIKIKLHPNSSQKKINELPRTLECREFEVWLKEKPIDNKANIALEKFLKKHFNKKVKILSGFNSRNKIVEVENEI